MSSQPSEGSWGIPQGATEITASSPDSNPNSYSYSIQQQNQCLSVAIIVPRDMLRECFADLVDMCSRQLDETHQPVSMLRVTLGWSLMEADFKPRYLIEGSGAFELYGFHMSMYVGKVQYQINRFLDTLYNNTNADYITGVFRYHPIDGASNKYSIAAMDLSIYLFITVWWL